MKNEELYVMRDALNAVPEKVSYQDEKKKTMVNFKFGVSKNKRMLIEHLKDVEAGLKPTEKYEEYQAKEQKLSKTYCRKDVDGKNIILPVVKGRRMGEQYDIIGVDDPESEYFLEFAKLEKEYKKEIDERKVQMEEFNEFLKQDSKFEPYLMPFHWLPDDLPQKAMDGIYFMIDFETVPEIETSKKQKNKKRK